MKGNWIDAEMTYLKAIELRGESFPRFEGYFNYVVAVGYFQRYNKILED